MEFYLDNALYNIIIYMIHTNQARCDLELMKMEKFCGNQQVESTILSGKQTAWNLHRSYITVFSG